MHAETAPLSPAQLAEQIAEQDAFLASQAESVVFADGWQPIATAPVGRWISIKPVLDLVQSAEPALQRPCGTWRLTDGIATALTTGWLWRDLPADDRTNLELRLGL